MKILMTLFSICLLSFSTKIQAQSQADIVLEYLKKNALPSLYGRDSSQDAMYEHYSKEEAQKRSYKEPHSMSPCHQSDDSLQIISNENISSFKKFFSAICTNPDGGEKNCTCEAWGTCSNSACECSILCPNDFKILDTKPKNDLNSASGISSFTNSDPILKEEFSDYQGFCWGFAILNQKLSKLVTFNKNKDNELNQYSSLYNKEKYINSIISKLDKNEPFEITGFKNIEELSKNSFFRKKITPIISKYWGKNAISLQGLNSISPTSIFVSKNDIENTVKETKERIANYQNPALVLTTKDGTFFKDAHVVIATSAHTISEGSSKICVADNNYLPNETDQCKNFLIINNGKINYYLGDTEIKEITRIQVAHHENAMTVQFVKSLHEQCLNEKDCNSK